MNVDAWRPDFLRASPLFQPLVSIYPKAWEELSQWPSLNTLNQVYPKVRQQTGKPLSFVPQAPKSKVFEEQYESRIYLAGEVQTRENNWHDFFNYLVWRRFSKIKSQINVMHFKAQQKRWQQNNQRTTLENFLTLFDENGIVVLSDSETLIHQLKTRAWHELFWQNRQAVKEHMHFYTVGHALYEKSLNPYIGMTGKAIILHKKKLDNELNELAYIDEAVSKSFHECQLAFSPSDLYPLPVLGIPGCYAENANETFYGNKTYFRPLNEVLS